MTRSKATVKGFLRFILSFCVASFLGCGEFENDKKNIKIAPSEARAEVKDFLKAARKLNALIELGIDKPEFTSAFVDTLVAWKQAETVEVNEFPGKKEFRAATIKWNNCNLVWNWLSANGDDSMQFLKEFSASPFLFEEAERLKLWDTIHRAHYVWEGESRIKDKIMQQCFQFASESFIRAEKIYHETSKGNNKKLIAEYVAAGTKLKSHCDSKLNRETFKKLYKQQHDSFIQISMYDRELYPCVTNFLRASTFWMISDLVVNKLSNVKQNKEDKRRLMGDALKVFKGIAGTEESKLLQSVDELYSKSEVSESSFEDLCRLLKTSSISQAAAEFEKGKTKIAF